MTLNDHFTLNSGFLASKSTALKHGFRSLATLILVMSANIKRKRTASRGFLAIARLSCLISNGFVPCTLLGDENTGLKMRD